MALNDFSTLIPLSTLICFVVMYNYVDYIRFLMLIPFFFSSPGVVSLRPA